MAGAYPPLFSVCNAPAGFSSTQTRHNLHEKSTCARARRPYSELAMRGAFVVQFRELTQAGQLEGVVEEVDTGKQAKFISENELIEFLRECFAETQQNDPKKGRNE